MTLTCWEVKKYPNRGFDFWKENVSGEWYFDIIIQYSRKSTSSPEDREDSAEIFRESMDSGEEAANSSSEKRMVCSSTFDMAC